MLIVCVMCGRHRIGSVVWIGIYLADHTGSNPGVSIVKEYPFGSEVAEFLPFLTRSNY